MSVSQCAGLTLPSAEGRGDLGRHVGPRVVQLVSHVPIEAGRQRKQQVRVCTRKADSEDDRAGAPGLLGGGASIKRKARVGGACQEHDDGLGVARVAHRSGTEQLLPTGNKCMTPFATQGFETLEHCGR